MIKSSTVRKKTYFLSILQIIIYCTFFSFQGFSQDDYISEDIVPYGFLDMAIPISYTHSSKCEYGSYTENNPNYAGLTIINANLAKISSTSIGSGISLHAPFLYLIFSSDKSRFRIADDIVLGFTLGSHTTKRTDYFTGEKLPITTSESMVGGSIELGVGVQFVYRLNRLVDIGAKLYPYYAYSSVSPGGTAQNKAFGIHARIFKFYSDFLYIVASKKNNPIYPNTINFKLKYLPGFKNNSFFLNLMYNHEDKLINNEIGFPMTPQISSVKSAPSKWLVLQVGWGLSF